MNYKYAGTRPETGPFLTSNEHSDISLRYGRSENGLKVHTKMNILEKKRVNKKQKSLCYDHAVPIATFRMILFVEHEDCFSCSPSKFHTALF